jgi:CMP-2-keto-3-deoxyoctulosonic acid synthetase
LEQLRALEHGRSIHVIKVARATHGIDTREQYEAFVKRMKPQMQTDLLSAFICGSTGF